MKAGTIEEGKYYDRNGNILRDGNIIMWESGEIEKVYEIDGVIGTAATPLTWTENGISHPLWIYPLSSSDLQEIEKVPTRTRAGR